MGFNNTEYQREWYHKNKEKAKKSRQLTRSKAAARWLEYKSTLACEKCGENEPSCLDFHHVDPSTKETSLGAAAACGWSMKKLLTEIEKCVVLCANCHRKLHARVVELADALHSKSSAERREGSMPSVGTIWSVE